MYGLKTLRTACAVTTLTKDVCGAKTKEEQLFIRGMMLLHHTLSGLPGRLSPRQRLALQGMFIWMMEWCGGMTQRMGDQIPRIGSTLKE